MLPTAYLRRPMPAETVASVAFLAPWALVALVLPDPWRGLAIGLTLVLGGLLAAAGGWSRRKADALGLDGAEWAFATVVSLGLAMVVLLARRQDVRWGPEALCHECGRLGPLAAPFCEGCGALG